MDVTVIGAGPAYSDDPSSLGACYLVRAGPAAMVLDLGHGSFARLAASTPPDLLAGILISHLHPDHFVDLVPLRHQRRYGPRPGRVRVGGPAALHARLDGLHGVVGFARDELDHRPLRPGPMTMGPFRVDVAAVRHDGDSYAFRLAVDDGPGLVYSGDVGVADDLVPLIRRGDVLLVECTFGTGLVPPGAMHLDASAIARLAQATHPATVLVTHVLAPVRRDALLEAVGHGHDARVHLVRPGDRFEV